MSISKKKHFKKPVQLNTVKNLGSGAVLGTQSVNRHPSPFWVFQPKSTGGSCSLPTRWRGAEARSRFTPPCPALGTAGTPRNAPPDLHPSPVTPRLCRKPRREACGGARCSRRHRQACRNQHQGAGAGRWKRSKLPPLLCKSHSKIIIPQKFNPGSATGLLPRRPPERGLQSQPCAHAGGKKVPSGDQAPREGRDPRCFHTKNLQGKEKKRKKAERGTEAETPVMPSGS